MPPRSRLARLRAPLLLALAALLALESIGGLVLLFVRVAFGAMPGVGLHIAGGLALTVVYTIYQWTHWNRVAPWRARPDYVIGLIAALSMALVNLTGLALAWIGLRAGRPSAPATYPTSLSAVHTLATMLVLTFAAGHLAAVLVRDRGGAREAERP